MDDYCKEGYYRLGECRPLGTAVLKQGVYLF